MNDKIINIVSKGLMIFFIVIGVVLCGIIYSYGNPYGMKIEQTNQMGREIAEAQGMQDKLGQEELNQFIEDTGIEKKNELLHEQGEKVKSTTMFTIGVMALAVVLIIVGVVIAIVGAPKKYMVGVISVVGFVILLLIIYYSTGTDIPAELQVAEEAKLVPEKDRLFTGDNWRIAGASMTATIWLIVAASTAAIASGVYKVVKG